MQGGSRRSIVGRGVAGNPKNRFEKVEDRNRRGPLPETLDRRLPQERRCKSGFFD